MSTTNGFLIVKFIDGLQIIPEVWFNPNEQSCFWPTKFKTKLRINKAIITRKMPQDSTWECLPIKRIFGKADTYANALEKLIIAQDTSHIDDTGMSSDEMRQLKKKKRRMKAKKTWLSSSESSSEKNFCLNDDKENHIKQHNKVNKMPAFPKLRQFVPNSQVINQTNKYLQKNNVLHEISDNVMNITDNSINKTTDTNDKTEFFIEKPTKNIKKDNFYDKSINKNLTTNERQTRYLTENFTKNIETENIHENEFKKQILTKINKILYKLDIMEKRICMLDEKMQSSNSFLQEFDCHFPISTLSELTHFEKQLQETKFKQGVINTFKLVGGNTAYAMIRNILKKSITNELAQYFSWAGKKKKRNFKDLSLATMVIQAVRTIYSHMTDNDIAEYTSKWLAQATLRISREKQSTLHEENDKDQQ